jgi:hypothetical protein
MGNCYNTPVLAAEDFIKSIMEKTHLKNLNYTFLENQFHILSDDYSMDKNYFVKNILPSFYSKDSAINKFLPFHDKLFEDILITDVKNEKMNYYLILLSIFSSINHEIATENFYTLLIKISLCYKESSRKRPKKILFDYKNGETQTKLLSVKDMKNIILTYLEINIVMTTHSVYKSSFNHYDGFVDKKDLENLVSNYCTAENVFKFYENVFRAKFDNKEITYEEFYKLVENKDYLFSFRFLRVIFFEFVKKLNYVGPSEPIMNTENQNN